MTSQSCRGCVSTWAQCRRETPFSRQARASSALPPTWSTSQGPHLFWSPQVCSLHHTKMIFLKDKSYTRTTSPAGFQFPVGSVAYKFLAEPTSSWFWQGSFQLCLLPLSSYMAELQPLQPSFGVSCFPASGPLHLLPPLPPLPSPSPQLLADPLEIFSLGPHLAPICYTLAQDTLLRVTVTCNNVFSAGV